MKLFSVPTGRLMLRIAAAVIGGYVMCWAIFDLLCAWLPFEKATLWYFTAQLAPLPFLLVLLWAFVARSAWRALAWPLGLAAGTAFLGWLR